MLLPIFLLTSMAETMGLLLDIVFNTSNFPWSKAVVLLLWQLCSELWPEPKEKEHRHEWFLPCNFPWCWRIPQRAAPALQPRHLLLLCQGASSCIPILLCLCARMSGCPGWKSGGWLRQGGEIVPRADGLPVTASIFVLNSEGCVSQISHEFKHTKQCSGLKWSPGYHLSAFCEQFGCINVW